MTATANRLFVRLSALLIQKTLGRYIVEEEKLQHLNVLCPQVLDDICCVAMYFNYIARKPPVLSENK